MTSCPTPPAKYVTSGVLFGTVARNSFNGKFTTKNDFPIRHFMLPLLTLTLEVKSLRTLFDIVFGLQLHPVKFEQNFHGRK